MARQVTGTKKSALIEIQFFIEDIMGIEHVPKELEEACKKFYTTLSAMKSNIVVGIGRFIENGYIKQEKECEDDYETNETYRQFMGDSVSENEVFYHIDPEWILIDLLKEKHVAESDELTELVKNIIRHCPEDYSNIID